MGSYFMSSLLLLLCWNVSKASLIGGTCGQNMSRVNAERAVLEYYDRLDDGFKDCASECLKNLACEAFSHVKGSCLNYYTRYGNQAYYDDRCKKDDDCSYEHGHCLRGACTCSIGYSYDFEKHFCVRECAWYGSRFSVYNNTGIVDCNIKTLKNHSLKRCSNACRDEATFACVSAEFMYGFGPKHGTCYLCDVIWADIPPPNRYVGTDNGWSISYRHCKEL